MTELVAPITVLVGFAESLAAVESVWSLLRADYEVIAFTREDARSALRHDPRVRLHRVVAPERDLAATIDAVCALAEAERAAVLMPLDDVSVLVLDAVSLRCPGLVVAGVTGDLAALSLDKRLQLEAASRAGFAVPPTLVVDDTIGRADVVPAFPAPWIVKPALAVEVASGHVGKGAAQVVTTPAELRSVTADRDDPVLVQPLVRGVGQGLFGWASGGECRLWSAHERIRMMNPAGSGSSACRSCDPDPELVAAASRFLRDVGWEGLFMLEFLKDDSGTPWFMELNGRTWGSMVLATRRGLEYPAWAVAGALDPEFRPPSVDPRPHLTARHLGRELLHLAFVARGRRLLRRTTRAGMAPNPSLLTYPTLPGAARSVLSWHRDERAYNVQRGHLGVVVSDTVRTVLDTILPRQHR
jgi:biotin carboxylase